MEQAGVGRHLGPGCQWWCRRSAGLANQWVDHGQHRYGRGQRRPDSLGLGLELSSSKLSVDILINFQQTQGNVNALPRPRLPVIPGTRSSLRVGQSTTYVSKVGTNFSTSVNQVTTETRDLKTGLDLAMFGDFSDNPIYTRIRLAISEIVCLNRFTALGSDLTLPTGKSTPSSARARAT